MKRQRLKLPAVFNRTEFEWRTGTRNHAVKIDTVRDGWESVCGMKFTSFVDVYCKKNASAGSGFCKRCLHKTRSTLAIIPNQAIKDCFEVKSQ